MAQQTYPVPCGCGNVVEVPLAAAGTTVPCRCGEGVEVPSLARLKASVGQEAVSADFELEQLIGAGRLPLEHDCVECGRRTGHTVTVVVECERKVEAKDVSRGQRWVMFLLFGWLGYFLVRQTYRPGHGKDLIFRLPVRLCEPCSGLLTSRPSILDAFRRTPVYARLLEKYPYARIEVQGR